MPSPEHEAIVALYQSDSFLNAATVAEQREAMEAMSAGAVLPEGTTATPVDAGGVPAEWVRSNQAPDNRSVLYLHGGGYVIGSINTHRTMAANIALQGLANVLLIDYRLAPEHPFPAALDDALAAYQWLLAQGQRAERIAVAGDSAGGGLTLALLMALRDQGLPLPACAVCMSPWVDLEGTGESCAPGAVDDPMVSLDGLQEMGRHYIGSEVGSEALRNPLAAPLYGNYEGLPPLLIQVGTREILLSDAVRVADKAAAAGVEVTLEKKLGLIHVWQALPGVPEADEALARIGGYIRMRIG